MASLAASCFFAAIFLWFLVPKMAGNPVPMTTDATSPLRLSCEDAAVVVERAAFTANSQFPEQCLRWCSTYRRNLSLCDTIRAYGELEASQMNLGIDVTATNDSIRSVLNETLNVYYQRVTWSQGTLELMTSRQRKYVCDVYDNLGVPCPNAFHLCDVPDSDDVRNYCGFLAVLRRLDGAKVSITTLMTSQGADVPTADPGSDFEASTRQVQGVRDLVQLSRVNRLLATIATGLTALAAAL